MNTLALRFAGHCFKVDCGALVATDAYTQDGRALTYEITGGSLTGNTAAVGLEWRHLSGQSYAISWQEEDGPTVIHIDDFEAGHSLAFFTTPNGQFFRLEGSLRSVDIAGQDKI